MKVELLGEGPFYAELLRQLLREDLELRPAPLQWVAPDLGVAANLRRVLSPAELRRYRLGVIGYHPSLLPRHRGPNAIEATIRAGDAVTGGTVYRFVERVDAGPVLARRCCFVLPGETARQLYRRELFPLGVGLLTQVVRSVRRGARAADLAGRQQDERFATYHDREGDPLQLDLLSPAT